jgi:hypothetical protein
MTYTTAEGRQQILDALAAAIEQIDSTLAFIGEAYEQLDERMAERLEAELFAAAQGAYGAAKRTYASFADRYALESRAFEPPPAPAPGSGAKALIDEAAQAASRADELLVELQDSMLPVEVGDAELRAGIARTRELLGNMRPRARELVRTLGR